MTTTQGSFVVVTALRGEARWVLHCDCGEHTPIPRAEVALAAWTCGRCGLIWTMVGARDIELREVHR